MSDEMFAMKEKILAEGSGWGLCVRDNDVDAVATVERGQLFIIHNPADSETPPDEVLVLLDEPKS